MKHQGQVYIPVGSIIIDQEGSNLPQELWALAEHRDWLELALAKYDDQSSQRFPTSCLRPEVKRLLSKSPSLIPFANLFKAGWVKVAFKVSSEDPRLATLRVSFLPDDVLRSTIGPIEKKLRTTRQSLLQTLDYSRKAWEGVLRHDESTEPTPYEPVDSSEEVSLLQLFNTIPSPRPDPSEILDPYLQEVALSILDGKVPGLKTELYPYQKRSAALMLQKETQPGRVLDPRLIHLRDLAGEGWYADFATGEVLSQPRLYDGINGGILAEEMGAGKTVICLSLILATRDLPTIVPELYGPGSVPIRPQVGSLIDMAASCATRHAAPWRPWFDAYAKQTGLEFSRCKEALQQNRGYYSIPPPERRRVGRHPERYDAKPTKVYMSAATIVVVPGNLVAQWKQEVRKHTPGLKSFCLTGHKNEQLPAAEELSTYDIILLSQVDLIKLTEGGNNDSCPLSDLHFKRCIVDEGHKLGTAGKGIRTNLLASLDMLKFSSRWVVTGTPAHGLYGVAQSKVTEPTGQTENGVDNPSAKFEKKDLERIGSMTTKYLKARPWANTWRDANDTTADWRVYIMLPKHGSKSQGRWECLRTTLNSLIIRHRLDEVGELLPPVNEKIVVLDGSYQDRLSTNIFSMMIIFNAVQSERTDMDYFFHPTQRGSLMQIVHNLKQSTFFGSSFFTAAEIKTSVETAEKFLEEKKIALSEDDESLLKEAIKLGHSAFDNHLRNLSNRFHELPVSVDAFPGGSGPSWSLGDDQGDRVCTCAGLLLSLQKLISSHAGNVGELNALLNGGLVKAGEEHKEAMLQDSEPKATSSQNQQVRGTLAGNTKLGSDVHATPRSGKLNKDTTTQKTIDPELLSGPLGATLITATASVKMSYLLDAIIKHQDDEKIIVFYENDNVAWYLASMLDVLQIQHLIYAKGLDSGRRARYVETFNHNSKFRVLLMDLSQAAFGLDMREASRIYFINPVLNPQVQVQAIGRARRISQKKPVSVEILVLRNSIDEIILERKEHMTQAEHQQAKSILDVRAIYEWIKNVRIAPLPAVEDDHISQMARLTVAQPVFSTGFGREVQPDEGLVPNSPIEKKHAFPERPITNGVKRSHDDGPGRTIMSAEESADGDPDPSSRPAQRVPFAG